MLSSLCTPLCNSDTLVFLVFSCLLSVCCSFKYCNKIDAAKFKTDEGEIDLWSLARYDGEPRFKDISDTSIDTQFYSFNPGNSWSDSRGKLGDLNGCKNIAACMRYGDPKDLSRNVYVNVGTQSSAEFVHDAASGSCILSLKGKYFTTPTNTLITISCDEDQEGILDDVVSDEDSDNWIYRSTLHTRYACPQSILSIGSILLIMFAAIIVVYLVVGILVNKFKRGASGKDVIPNVAFWSDFPFLVKDGAVFCFTSCKTKVCRSKEGYESI